jgi:hypothetical protein
MLRYTRPSERGPLYTAAIGIVWGTGTILGPVVGGAVVSVVHIQTPLLGSELAHAGKQFCNMAVVRVPLASLGNLTLSGVKAVLHQPCHCRSFRSRRLFLHSELPTIRQLLILPQACPPRLARNYAPYHNLSHIPRGPYARRSTMGLGGRPHHNRPRHLRSYINRLHIHPTLLCPHHPRTPDLPRPISPPPHIPHPLRPHRLCRSLPLCRYLCKFPLSLSLFSLLFRAF